ncbi:far1-related sequence 5-like protein [Vibrio phage vB_VpS_PG07]|uniref:Uncharacterized protein n=3 Tax=Pogseptimavirus TaxID=2732037 RepID=A0A411BKM1_9CAUD|nr:far1-related sequence 5-like protein [Vibrio phage vB_VpS_PG07]YP_009819546.1 hypothetical protein HOV08_gp029 [Vibrio phage VspSw_1]AXQ66723.1 far1-related sequence 5-like protein [Vibrio phage vB_VpS_PG07]QAY02102.1 hypothetical protein VspSw1_29 [Vibrio phage VspSw_1]QKN88423.1 hypothetical protein vBValSX1_30 [Vibrio phage vB_ValS_X1]
MIWTNYHVKVHHQIKKLTDTAVALGMALVCSNQGFSVAVHRPGKDAWALHKLISIHNHHFSSPFYQELSEWQKREVQKLLLKPYFPVTIQRSKGVLITPDMRAEERLHYIELRRNKLVELGMWTRK